MPEMDSKPSSGTSNCPICISDVSSKDLIVCKYCPCLFCKACCKKYLLESAQDPHCMDCRKGWLRKDLVSLFSKHFVNNDLKTHKEKILFDKELARLPETQAALDRDATIVHLNRQLVEMSDQLWCLGEVERANFKAPLGTDGKPVKGFRLNSVQKNAYEEFKKNKRELEEKIRNAHNERSALELERSDQNTGKVRKAEGPKFLCKCPLDDCRGFVNMNGTCGLCKTVICKDCRTIKQEGHECKAEDVQTVKLLAKDSKPCPKCATLIFKISGCNQMWCTQCKSGFDWVTGKVDDGPIHNPHFFEFMRQNGTQNNNPVNENVCRENLDHHFSHNLYNRQKVWGISENRPHDIVRMLIHIRMETLQKFDEREKNNEDLRIRYLKKLLDEKAFKRHLQIRDKKHAKNKEFHDLLSMFVRCSTDVLFRYYDEIGKKKTLFDTFLNELKELQKYVLNCFAEIEKAFDSHQTIVKREITETLNVTLRNDFNGVTYNDDFYHVGGLFRNFENDLFRFQRRRRRRGFYDFEDEFDDDFGDGFFHGFRRGFYDPIWNDDPYAAFDDEDFDEGEFRPRHFRLNRFETEQEEAEPEEGKSAGVPGSVWKTNEGIEIKNDLNRPNGEKKGKASLNGRSAGPNQEFKTVKRQRKTV